MSPYDFENLIVRLLIKMGYGTLKQNEMAVTPKSGDEGIDGIVSADKFGFDSIYIQAKKWRSDSTVGRPEIQKFLGALAGQGATKGIFITTAHFSKEAIAFAEKQLHQKIVLVDGNQLTELMIEYNLGVSVVETYVVKRVDYDFFNDELLQNKRRGSIVLTFVFTIIIEMQINIIFSSSTYPPQCFSRVHPCAKSPWRIYICSRGRRVYSLRSRVRLLLRR